MILSDLHQEVMTASFMRVVKRSGILIFITSLLTTLLDQWITNNMDDILKSPDGLGPRLWIFGGLSLLVGLVVPVIQFLLVLAGKSPAGILVFLKQNFKLSLIEMMRAWGNSMTWAFLFIVPGFVYYIRYLFVMFIVCDDAKYAAGEIDALKKSVSLSRGIWWKLFALFFVFAIVIPLLMTFFDEYKLLSENFLTGALFCLFESVLQILFVLIILRLYRKRALYETAI